MNKKAADKTTQSSSGKDFTVGRLALDFLDTTWRIAIPVVIFAGLGLFADKEFSLAPWLTLLGTLVGFTLAALLIRKQLKDVDGSGGKK